MPESEPSASIEHRLKELCDRHFAGGQRRMARALNVSPATMGRWLRGEQPPTYDALVRLIELHQIDSTWLLTGTATTEGQAGVVRKPPALPIYHAPLAGPPTESEPAFRGERFDVIPALVRPSRYLWRIDAEWGAILERLAICQGDLLLVDADQDAWRGLGTRSRLVLVANSAFSTAFPVIKAMSEREALATGVAEAPPSQPAVAGQDPASAQQIAVVGVVLELLRAQISVPHRVSDSGASTETPSESTTVHHRRISFD